VRWHGRQGGVVTVGQAKLRVQRPRLRDVSGEVAIPAYAAMQADEGISRRVADTLACNVSTRKYARVVRRCAEEVGISKSAVSRQFVKQSAQALAKLMDRDFAQVDLVAIYVDGIIVAKHHIIAAVGVDATGRKHVLGLVPGSSENAKRNVEATKMLIEIGKTATQAVNEQELIERLESDPQSAAAVRKARYEWLACEVDPHVDAIIDELTPGAFAEWLDVLEDFAS
jgi:hypothetical protein